MAAPVANLSAVVTGAVQAGYLSAVEASKPWVEMVSKLILGLYGRLVTASLGADTTATGEKAGKYVLPVLLALLPVVFLCGAVWALTCRTMKGPGLGGARVPRAMFKADPKRYFAAVRAARKARRGASGTGWKLLVAAAVVAYAAYLAAKTFY